MKNCCPRLLAQPCQPSLTSTRRKTTPVSLRVLAIKDAEVKTLSSNHCFQLVDLISSTLNYLQHKGKPFNICWWYSPSSKPTSQTETASSLLAGPCLVLNMLFIAPLFSCSFYQTQLLQSAGVKAFHRGKNKKPGSEEASSLAIPFFNNIWSNTGVLSPGTSPGHLRNHSLLPKVLIPLRTLTDMIR